MQQVGAAHEARGEEQGPVSLANRMASYIKDASYIQAYVRREYGPKHLPTIETIKAMQSAHARRRVVRELYHGDYNPGNDNGEPWRPKALAAPQKPRPKPVLVLPSAHKSHKTERTPYKQPAPVSQVRYIPGEPTGKRIIRITAETFGFKPADLLGRGRQRDVVLARITAARMLRNVKMRDGSHRWSLPQIAKMLGRDHSTICYSLEMFGPYRAKYPEMKALCKLLRRKLA